MNIKMVTVFQEVLDALQASSKKFSQGMRGKKQLGWMLGEDDTRPGKFDFEKIQALFDRSQAAEQFAEVMENSPNSVRQQQAVAKNQSDYLSGLERDYRMRHRSRIRYLAHEAAAKLVAGDDRGVLVAGLGSYLDIQSKRMETPNDGSE